MKLVVALVVSKLYYTITIIFYIILMILTGALGQTCVIIIILHLYYITSYYITLYYAVLYFGILYYIL